MKFFLNLRRKSRDFKVGEHKTCLQKLKYPINKEGKQNKKIEKSKENITWWVKVTT